MQLSSNEFAKRAGVTYHSVFNWIKDGKIVATKQGKNYLIDESELAKVKKKRKKTSVNAEQQSQGMPKESPVLPETSIPSDKPPMQFDIVKQKPEGLGESVKVAVEAMKTPDSSQPKQDKPKLTFWQGLTGQKPKEKKPVEAKSTEPTSSQPKEEKVKKPFDKRILFYSGGGLLAIPGLIMLIGYIMHPLNNMAAGPFGAILFLGGAGLAITGVMIKSGTGASSGMAKVMGGQLETTTQANCMRISPDNIEFVYFDPKTQKDQLMGQPQKCANDNKWYYVEVMCCPHCKSTELTKGDDGKYYCKKDGDKELGTVWKAFELPDTTYRDPREFANNLNIPAHRKLAQSLPSVGQAVSIGLMVLVIIVLPFLMILTQGSPAQTNASNPAPTPTQQGQLPAKVVN